MTIGRSRLVSATFIHLRAVSGTALLFCLAASLAAVHFPKSGLEYDFISYTLHEKRESVQQRGRPLAARLDGLPFISLHLALSSIESAASRCGRRDTTKAVGPPGPAAFTFLLELDVRDAIINDHVKFLILRPLGILRLITQQDFSARRLLSWIRAHKA